MRTLFAFAAVTVALFLVGVAAAAMLAPRPEKNLYHRPPERVGGEPCGTPVSGGALGSAAALAPVGLEQG